MESAIQTDRAVIGRDAEQKQLRRALSERATGLTVVVLSGPAGSGKSALWREHVGRARRRRAVRVLSCAPSETEAGYPHAGLRDLLAGCDRLDELPGPLRDGLELALLRRSPNGAGGPAPHVVGAAVHALLAGLLARGSVLLAVDGLQWLDAESRRALWFAVRRLGPLPLRVLLAVRDENGVAEAARLCLPVLAGSVHHLPLGPMAPADVARLVRARTRSAVPRERLDLVAEFSAGNPGVALELAEAAAAGRTTLERGRPVVLPGPVREVLEEEHERLTPGLRSVLMAAANLARPTLAVLYAACPGPGEIAALHQALEGGLLQVQGAAVAPARPLLGALAYAEARPEERRSLHDRLAGLAADPLEHVHHLLLSGRGPGAGVAAALDEAARWTALQGRPATAAALAAHAVQLTPPGHPEDQRRRSLVAAAHGVAAGRLDEATALLADVLADAPPGHADRAWALYQRGRIEAQQSGFPAAAGLFDAALAEAGDDRALCIELKSNLAFARLVAGNIPGAAALAGEALELADGGEVPARARASAVVGAALFEFLTGHGVRFDLLEGLAAENAAEEEAAGDAGAPGTPLSLHLPHIPPTILKWADRTEEAREWFAAVRARAADRGDRMWAPWLSYHLSELECWAGHWDRAADLAVEAVDGAARTGQDGVLGFALYARALVGAHRGEADAAQTAADGLAASREAGSVTAAQLNRAVLGFVALSEGDTARALEHLVAVRSAVAAMGLADPGVVRYLPDLIEALVGTGDLDEAAREVDRLLARAEALDRPSARAAAHRGRALVRIERGDPEAALRETAAAQWHHRRVKQPFELARTLLVEGTIRRRAGQKRPAWDTLDRAASLFESLGAPLWAARAVTEAGRIGGRRPSPPTLTPVERRVAALVVAGCSNKLVAAELFLSVKTVESRLSRIYRKLGVASRRDLYEIGLAFFDGDGRGDEGQSEGSRPQSWGKGHLSPAAGPPL